MKELLPDIERWREAGKRVAVATVVQAYGSAPRRAGAKMAISEDGEFVGSVSGGCVENDVVEHAKQVIDDDKARLVPYGITDDMAFDVGLACGGRIEVFIQPFGRAFPTEKPVAFAYVIDGSEPNVGNGLLAWEFGKHRGSLGLGDALDAQVAQDAIATLREGQPRQLRYPDAPGGPLRVFVDTYPAQPTIYIFGGVHIGVALCHLAKQVGGFRVVVVDARGVWATRERFPEADEIHIQHADDYLAAHPLASNAYVAVLSHDPKLDDPALIGALKSPARYIGAIGSGKTQSARRERLKAAGITDEQIGRLYGPIGLSIEAQTPEEISVAILGEMIRAKNSGPATAAPAEQGRAVAAAR
jgi:xanthine dehydrogenase accessory factor